MAGWRADARYTRLVEDHGSTLLHLAILLTGNRHDAEDIVQDVLISVASAWPVTRPLPYLKRAVANRSVDYLRRRRDILTGDVPEQAFDDVRLLKHEQDREFFDLVRRLPERQREVMILRYHADLDDTTIGRMLGISVKTVRSQAHHALEKLRINAAAREEQR